MKGNETFKVAVRTLEEIARETLAANNLTVDDLDLYVPHQANMRILKAVADRLGLAAGKGHAEPRSVRQHVGGLDSDCA